MRINLRTHVAFDVDGTLIYQAGPLENTPKYENIEMFKKLQKLGCQMYIWSGGGEGYAKMIADRLGLKAQIVSKGSFKPDIVFDDMDVNLGKINIVVSGE